MKSIRLTVAFLLLCLAGAGNAIADRGGHGGHGGHGHFDLVIGPYWGPWYYPPPLYYYPPYYPPGMVERASPPVYIEQQATPPVSSQAAPQTNYWYYCDAAKGYYPYVKECPSGWQRVLPQPPGQP